MSNQHYNHKLPAEAEFFTASAATYSVLEDLQYGVERFNHFHKFCIDGIMEMNFDGNPQIHVAEIDMLPWKAIDWPMGMVDWRVIGFRCGAGIKAFIKDDFSLIRDEKGCIPQDYRNNCDVSKADETNAYVPFLTEDLYYSGGNHYYGTVCTGAAGYFDVDTEKRVFNFFGVVNNVNKVYLEYITHGVNPTGKTVIDARFFKPLQNYIHWQRKEHSDNFGLAEKSRAQQLYEKSLDKAIVECLDVSQDDIYDILRRSQRQTPKG